MNGVGVGKCVCVGWWTGTRFEPIILSPKKLSTKSTIIATHYKIPTTSILPYTPTSTLSTFTPPYTTISLAINPSGDLPVTTSTDATLHL